MDMQDATEALERVEADAGGEADSQSTPSAADLEAEARAAGWRPKEEWDGRGEWRDAAEFLAVRENNLALKRKEVDHLKGEIAKLKREVKKLTIAEQRAYSSALADIKAEMEQAVETGDVAAFRAADKKMEELRQEATADIAAIPGGEDPQEQFDAFREMHNWYDKANLASATETEIEARLYADRLADRWAKEGRQQTMKPSEFFAAIAEATLKKFPLLKMKAARAKPASDVSGGSRPGAAAKAKSFANLPAEAKAQADRFFKMGVIKAKDIAEAREKYVRDYQWD